MTLKKVSDITVQDLASFLRIAETDDSEEAFLGSILAAAKAYAASFCGRSVEEMDEKEDFVPAVLVIAGDMYDNRSMCVDSSNVNRTIEAILGMHSVNLL